ncbi:hypothetical protein C2W62_07440 [Candidatus Entotheonella serta]|nr:hypothetical protein C2W62_07440 [Candidatus Entotheonella serta]
MKSTDSIPVASVTSPPRSSNRLEAPARLDNHRLPSIPAMSRQPRLTRTPLIASVNARLICAMPRASGPLGSDIVLLGHNRHRVHRLIDDGSRNVSPELSPDGAYLAYTSYRGGTPNIYLRHLASGQDTQLTSGPSLALPGTWSPNGRYLLFKPKH